MREVSVMYTASAVPIMPVSVQVTDLSPYRFAATVEDLMGMLLSDRWPEKASPVYRSAVARCIDAISLQSGGDKARGAFIDAAHDAGIAVSPDDDRKANRRRTDKVRSGRGAERSKQPLAGHLR
jgi:hypothetical protein